MANIAESGWILKKRIGLHRKEVLALDIADVVDPADVGMADLPCQADFVEKVLQALRIVSQIFRAEISMRRCGRV